MGFVVPDYVVEPGALRLKGPQLQPQQAKNTSSASVDAALTLRAYPMSLRRFSDPQLGPFWNTSSPAEACKMVTIASATWGMPGSQVSGAMDIVLERFWSFVLSATC